MTMLTCPAFRVGRAKAEYNTGAEMLTDVVIPSWDLLEIILSKLCLPTGGKQLPVCPNHKYCEEFNCVLRNE